MVRRSVEYLNELPRPQRRLLLALFFVVELVCVVLEPHFCRFSRMTPLRRAALVRGWRRSSFLPHRVLGDALKAMTTVIYMSHPAALEYIGAYSGCDRPLDPFQLPVKREALRALDTVT